MNPFNRKSMEKVLFAAYMPTAQDKRRTRKYLKKMEKAFEIGLKDGKAGKPLVPQEALMQNDDSPLLRGMIRRAYMAYQAGHRVGSAEWKEVR